MTAWAYYNEFDPHAAEWLRNLIDMKLIAPGEVDDRDIRDIHPDDLRGFAQCHFFAGIGVWSYALRRAGWPDSRPVWTGSCPCQGFSAAGQQRGFDDERHLWPDWYRLIKARKPPVIFGEQVQSALIVGKARNKTSEFGPYGLYDPDRETQIPTAWFDLVCADLEEAVYAVGVRDTPAAGSGAPHIRQRLYFVAHRLEHAEGDGRVERWAEPGGRSIVGGRGAERLVDDERSRLEGHAGNGDRGRGRSCEAGSVAATGGARRLADSDVDGRDTGIARDGRSEEGARGEDWHVDDRRSTPRRLADSAAEGREGRRGHGAPGQREAELGRGDGRELGGLADSNVVNGDGAGHRAGIVGGRFKAPAALQRVRDPERLADSIGGQLPQQIGRPEGRDGDGSDRPDLERSAGWPGPTNGFWRDVDWLFCRDGKWRPVEPGTFPLVDGSTFHLDSGSPFEGKSRQEILKGAGNAIVSEVAISFIEDYLEATGEIVDGDFFASN